MAAEERSCPHCGKPVTGRRNKIFCDSTCRAAHSKASSEKRRQAQPRGGARRSSAMIQAFNKAARAADHAQLDAATFALARAYARQIDADPEKLASLGPKLRLVLVQLNMTPRSRATLPVTKQVTVARNPRRGGGRLDELRARRAERAAGTAPPA